VELKSRAGGATKAQKQRRLELLAAGDVWLMARSARAAMMALHPAGVVFRRQWKPPPNIHSRLPPKHRYAARSDGQVSAIIDCAL
jgi:hypothetical protein